MTELTTDIGAFDKDKRSVPVTFTSGEIVHTRDVNAVLDVAGEYDEAATEVRVSEVARGVAAKISLGVITAAVPEPDLELEPETPAADEPSEE